MKDSLEMIKQKASMGVQLAIKHPDYALYTGAAYDDAMSIALIRAMEIAHKIPDSVKENVAFIKAYLQQRQMAFFGVTADALTRVSLALGDSSVSVTSEKNKQQ